MRWDAESCAPPARAGGKVAIRAGWQRDLLLWDAFASTWNAMSAKPAEVTQRFLRQSGSTGEIGTEHEGSLVRAPLSAWLERFRQFARPKENGALKISSSKARLVQVASVELCFCQMRSR
jgi:hypothetical protein